MQHLAASLLGLGNGATYAALALALVLTYRSSGVINFATGAQALYAAYTYAFLRQGQLFLLIPGLPTTVNLNHKFAMVPALLLTLVIAALVGALLYGLVFRPLRHAPPLAKAVASLGVLVILQAMMSSRMGTRPVIVSAIYPSERWTWQGMTLLSDRVYLAISVIAMTLVITALYRWTRFGLDTRAAAESETGAYVSGISPDRIALLNWMIAGAVAGAAGVLIAPLSPVMPATYTLFVVPALAAAIVGGFQHLIPAVVAGLAIGMIQAWLVFLPGKWTWMPAWTQTGLGEIVPLVVMMIALLFTGRAVPERGTLLRTPLGRAPRPRSYTVPIVMGFVVGTVALILTHGSERAAVISTFIYAILALSLVVVTGYAGQVSLAQLALAGAAAFTLSFLTTSWGVPFPFAPLLAALMATVVGVLVGLPALRLRGLTLGVVTLALAFGLEAMWFRNSEIVPSFGANVTSPSLFGTDLGVGSGAEFPRLHFGFMCLLVLVLIAFGVGRLRTSSLGSAMLAVRANERSAAGVGVNVVFVKVISFAIASFIAGLAGALLAYRQGIVSWESFAALAGLAILSTAYLAGVTSVFGGVQAGIIVAGGIVFFFTDKWFNISGETFLVISGVLLILTLKRNPEGIAAGGHEIADKIAERRQKRKARKAAPADGAEAVPLSPAMAMAPSLSTRTAPDADAPIVLEVEDLTVRYGNVTAVSELTLRVPAGGIIGLIGPNGAGKTSAIDAITGFAKAEGAVLLEGERIDGLKTHQRVRRGLARTFQQLELYDDLSVEENVSAAAFGVKGDARHGAVKRALDLVGAGDLRLREAGDLSQGQRQLVSIARACAADPHVVLLDEPAAGLDTTESKWLGERIRNISATGTGVLLVDHDVALVLSICDYIYVLDFGSVIAEGDPAFIRANRVVADAYLGNVHDSAAVTA